jgi:hypothetical protein
MHRLPRLNERVRVPFGFEMAEAEVVQWYESPGGYTVLVDLDPGLDLDPGMVPVRNIYPLEEVEAIDEGEAGEA